MAIELYNEDNMQLMARYPDKHFDLAIVDPPYGIDINMNMGRKKGQPKRHNDKDWDNSIPNEDYFTELFRVSKNQIIWGGNYFPLPLTKSWIFWDKNVPEGVSFADGELAWTSFDTAVRKFQWRWNGMLQQNMKDKEERIHPTQKPIALYEWILQNYAERGNLILDTHLGSGSSRIAADKGGFNFVGFEIDADYYEKSKKRFNDFKSQLRMF